MPFLHPGNIFLRQVIEKIIRHAPGFRELALFYGLPPLQEQAFGVFELRRVRGLKDDFAVRTGEPDPVDVAEVLDQKIGIRVAI